MICGLVINAKQPQPTARAAPRTGGPASPVRFEFRTQQQAINFIP